MTFNREHHVRISKGAIALAVVAALSINACASDDIAGVPNSVALSSKPITTVSVERPWRGECDVVAQFITEVTLRIDGSCQLAHIGRASVIAYQTITAGPSGIAYTNTAVYTSSTGDELHTTNVGVATPNADGLWLSGTETAVGGTGRFANANGSAILTGAVRFTGPTTTIGSYALEGRLTY